jgi:hypothetical protein
MFSSWPCGAHDGVVGGGVLDDQLKFNAPLALNLNFDIYYTCHCGGDGDDQPLPLVLVVVM